MDKNNCVSFSTFSRDQLDTPISAKEFEVTPRPTAIPKQRKQMPKPLKPKILSIDAAQINKMSDQFSSDHVKKLLLQLASNQLQVKDIK